MTQRATTITGEVDRAGTRRRLEEAFARIREELAAPGAFPPEALADAERAAADPDLPRRDETALPLCTIDPPGSMDLDQALHIAREGDGYRVRYAIADVPAFVRPGSALDEEARRRGQTIYCPDTRVPLHPAVMSEDAASLLPGQVRPAFVWEVRLDADGVREAAEVYRAMVCSRRRYTYDEVQQQVDAGSAEETLLLLREVGRLRVQRESDRGGASLPMPSQEVHVDGDGRYRLRRRPLREAEDWNAQISLLTGMVAAEIMLEGGIGILRTMPAPSQQGVDRFRRQARALGVAWPEGMAYGDFLRTLDWQDPAHLAIIHDATALFRGAGYTPFDGAPPTDPALTVQAALAAPYAHVTAPLRRLVDRFGLVACAALTAGQEVPDWVRAALPELPQTMQRSEQLARTVDRACTDAVEAAALQHRVGERFRAVVVDRAGDRSVVVQVTDPAVTARADGEAGLGEEVAVELVRADVAGHEVRFAILD